MGFGRREGVGMGLGLLVVPPEGVCFCFCAWFEGGVVFVAVEVDIWASASAAGVSREQGHEKEEPSSAALQEAEEEAETAGG